MANFHQEDVLIINEDYEYDFGGDSLLGLRGQEEAMDLDKGILDQEESADPAEEESNLLGWGLNNLFEQDVLAPSPQPSLHGMSQLLAVVNTPTPEVHPGDYPPRSPTTEAALQTSDLDWVDEVEQVAPSQPELEEETVEEGHHQDPCLPLRLVSLFSGRGAPSRGSSRSQASQNLT